MRLKFKREKKLTTISKRSCRNSFRSTPSKDNLRDICKSIESACYMMIIIYHNHSLTFFYHSIISTPIVTQMIAGFRRFRFFQTY